MDELVKDQMYMSINIVDRRMDGQKQVWGCRIAAWYVMHGWIDG